MGWPPSFALASKGGQPPPSADTLLLGGSKGKPGRTGHSKPKKQHKQAKPDTVFAEGGAGDDDKDVLPASTDDQATDGQVAAGNQSADTDQLQDLEDDSEWWVDMRSCVLRSLVSNFQEALRSAMCHQGHAVSITALTSPLQCAQCMMPISLLQYAEHCTECRLICLQCFFDANRGLTCTRKLDG